MDKLQIAFSQPFNHNVPQLSSPHDRQCAYWKGEKNHEEQRHHDLNGRRQLVLHTQGKHDRHH